MDNDSTNKLNAAAGLSPQAAPQQWEGLTLEQLRFRRGMALVRREVGRERMNALISDVKTDVNTNGLRSFMFAPGVVKALRWTDYVMLGFNIVKLIAKLRRRK